MKKILVFSAILIMTIIAVMFNRLTTQQVQAETVSSTAASLLYETEIDGQYYYYDSYEDLVNQIYEDVYNDLYQQLHEQLLADMTETFYEQIYDQVETNLEGLLSQDEIMVYLGDLEEQIHNVVAIGEKSVFGVTSSTPDGTAVGSGVVYKYNAMSDEYYLITNYHVISNYLLFEAEYPGQINALKLNIRFADESTAPAIIMGYDTEVDIAVLRFSKGSKDFIAPATLGSIDEVQKGDFVFAVGNPGGYDFYNSITQGVVSGFDRKIDSDRYVDYIQHDAAINSGNSGGALFNLEGKLIGINVSKLVTVDIEGMGFAIQIDMLKRVVERIEKGDLLQLTIMPRLSADFYWVDIFYYDHRVILPSITIQLNEYVNLQLTLPDGVESGLIIKSIEEGGTLSGHFENADLLVKIDDYIIRDQSSFKEYFYENYESGDVITIYYYEFIPQFQEYSDTLLSKSVVLV